MRVVLGIDPGQKETGAVIRAGNECLAARVIMHVGWDTRAVMDELWDLSQPFLDRGDEVIRGVEGIEEPNAYRDGKKSFINWMPLLKTAAVLGAVMATFPQALIVPPGGHGKAPLRTYPSKLIGPRETTGTSGKFRHVRSAWDVAGAVPRLLAMGTPTGGRI